MEHPTRLQGVALVAEIAAGIAVVVSVVYLAIQIADNNRLLRSQAHYNAIDVMQRPLEMELENESLSMLIERCHSDPYDVESWEWRRCTQYYFILFNAWEYAYYQNEDGSIPPSLWDGTDGAMIGASKSIPAYARFWDERRVAFGEPFRSYVEGHFQRGQPTSAQGERG